MSSNLTKEQLKNLLINHGITTPPSSAKKEEFQRLYDEHVAPVLANKGDFSSDDEPDTSVINDIAPVVKILQNGETPSAHNGTADPSELSLSSMSDDELFTRLKEAGINCGPITSTTRGFYQKKLSQILKVEVATPTPPPPASAAIQSTADNEDDYSDNEEIDVVLKSQESDTSLVDNLGASATSAPQEVEAEFTNLRQRQRVRTEDAAVGHLLPPGRGPTPRPTIREARGQQSKEYPPLSFPSLESPMKSYTKESTTPATIETKAGRSSFLTRRNVILAVSFLLLAILVGVLFTCPETMDRLRETALDLYTKIPTLRVQPTEPVQQTGTEESGN